MHAEAPEPSPSVELYGGERSEWDDSVRRTPGGTFYHLIGWKDVLELGDLTSARGAEMYLPLWVRVFGGVATPMFSIRVVR